MAKFITQMLDGEPPTIFGNGKQSRDFTYVDNDFSPTIPLRYRQLLGFH
jgi:nucleoside-diphosphate-sugar epimerase